MSEPQTQAGTVLESGQTDETASEFERRFSKPVDQEVSEEVAEATEEVQAEEPKAEESDAAKLVREATETLRKQAAEQAAPTAVSPELAEVRGQVDLLKDQIVQMGRAQELPEPEGGFDVSVLDSPEVQAQLVAARESDDPTAEARALAVIAQHVYQAERGRDAEGVKALEKKLEGLEEVAQQQQLAQVRQRAFATGLQAAAKMGATEHALVQQFVDENELGHLQAHFQAHGTSDGYVPRSALGLWLASADPVTGRPNAEFAGNPSMLQAGVHLLATQLGGSDAEAVAMSKTATAAPSRGSGAQEDSGEELTPEQQIKEAIKAAAKARKKARAFG